MTARPLRDECLFQLRKASWNQKTALHLHDEFFENRDKIQPFLIRVKSDLTSEMPLMDLQTRLFIGRRECGYGSGFVND